METMTQDLKRNIVKLINKSFEDGFDIVIDDNGIVNAECGIGEEWVELSFDYINDVTKKPVLMRVSTYENDIIDCNEIRDIILSIDKKRYNGIITEIIKKSDLETR